MIRKKGHTLFCNSIDLLYRLSMDDLLKITDSGDVFNISVIVVFYLFDSIQVWIRHTKFDEGKNKSTDDLSSL